MRCIDDLSGDLLGNRLILLQFVDIYRKLPVRQSQQSLFARGEHAFPVLLDLNTVTEEIMDGALVLLRSQAYQGHLSLRQG